MDVKLAAILAAKTQPADAAERIQLAQLCQRPCKGLYATSARFYAEAFVAEPTLVDQASAVNRYNPNRYNAACAAALAGTGQGKDAAQLGDAERARWRKQALVWLRDDLAVHAERVQRGRPEALALVRQRLELWQRDDDLMGIRDPAALARLPAAEQAACTVLWADVSALLEKARTSQVKRAN